MMTPRLAAYLYAIMRKVKKGEYVEALMKCPECDQEIANWDDATRDTHIVIKQKIGDTKLYYCVVGCEGYWIVDPRTLGFERGNWSPSWEIIKKRILSYAEDKMGWDLAKLSLEPDNAEELIEHMKGNTELDDVDREDMIRHLDDEFITTEGDI
jgi:hypothetical protein